MNEINLAIIGVGQRGLGNLRNAARHEAVNIKAVCDAYKDRAEAAAVLAEGLTQKKAYVTTDYKEILADENIDAVIVATSWATHVEVAIDCLKAGKATGMEVGGAYSIKECWELIEAWEETKTPFMFLENCCFNREELLARNMAFAGLFGEIVHCHGAYGHDLREEITSGKEKRHYRLNEYLNRNCENYPTHELGPIAKVLDINRGNRMLSLVSVGSKAVGLESYVNDRKETIENKELIGKKFKQADIVNTIITCEDGSTISLRLDTTLPRSYNREFTVRGTRGMYEQSTHTVFIDGETEDYDILHYYKEHIGDAERFEEEYLPDMWKNMTPEQREAGHGGMDFFTFKSFFSCLRTGEPMPIDVYDAAAWMCISCLTEQSLNMGSMPVEIPDFTRGKYKNRKRIDY